MIFDKQSVCASDPRQSLGDCSGGIDPDDKVARAMLKAQKPERTPRRNHIDYPVRGSLLKYSSRNNPVLLRV